MVWRSGRVALVVGTILVMINQGEALLAGHVTGGILVRIGLTYCVPFLVALYAGRAAVRRARTGERSLRRTSYVCVSCMEATPCVVTVDAGATMPSCACCGATARWAELVT
jgi:hypothetical protein